MHSENTIASRKESEESQEMVEAKDAKSTHFSEVMLSRWSRCLEQSIPSADYDDVRKDCPLITKTDAFNQSVGQSCPEYTQVSYQRLKSLEDVFAF